MSGMELCNVPNWRFHFPKNVLFVFCVFVLFNSSYSQKSEKVKCIYTSSHHCIFPNVEGFDLSPLCQTPQGLKAQKDNVTFHFQLCGELKIGDKGNGDCYSGVSVCVYNTSTQHYTNLGFPNETFISLVLNNPEQILYKHSNIITTVQLVCDTSKTSLELKNYNTTTYELNLISSASCKQPTDDKTGTDTYLSTGSVLVIVFIVLTSVYFVGGALVLKCLRGAEGKEMIPNYDFWISLPGLVREGVVFSLGGCQIAQAYDRI